MSSGMAAHVVAGHKTGKRERQPIAAVVQEVDGEAVN